MSGAASDSRVRGAGALFLAIATACGCAAQSDTIGEISTDAGAAGCSAGLMLKHRPEGATVSLVTGMYQGTAPDSWPLIYRGQFVTITGQGYLNMGWQIEYASKAGLITPPIISLASGLFLHVGGGSGRNLADPQPGTTGSWLGNAQDGLSYMPDGTPTPWQDEFYYLDGEVTITQNETDGEYNVVIAPKTYAQVIAPGTGLNDPGVVCDPG